MGLNPKASGSLRRRLSIVELGSAGVVILRRLAPGSAMAGQAEIGLAGIADAHPAALTKVSIVPFILDKADV
jgi:hypothetical protein